MAEKQPNNPLHGITLEMVVTVSLTFTVGMALHSVSTLIASRATLPLSHP